MGDRRRLDLILEDNEKSQVGQGLRGALAKQLVHAPATSSSEHIHEIEVRDLVSSFGQCSIELNVLV
ncbi:MAG: hypothetical protein ACRDJ0_06120 [Actinomycetota bacterium]